MERYTITLDAHQLNLIFGALARLPYGEVAKTISEIDGQLVAQREALAEADAGVGEGGSEGN